MVENEVNIYIYSTLSLLKNDENYLMIMEKHSKYSNVYKKNVKEIETIAIWMKEHNNTPENYFEIID